MQDLLLFLPSVSGKKWYFKIEMFVLKIFIFLGVFAFDPLSILNSNQRLAVDEYRGALGVDVNRNDNTGIVSYNDRLLQNNPCIRQLAEKLYGEILSDDAIHNRNQPRRGRPQGAPSVSIVDRALNPRLQQGSFWQMALRYAKGNTNLAMTLVGICGHDNIMQSGVIRCPTEYSNIYYPESLGAGVDISPSMRQRVILYQGDDGSGLYIPAKYYHTMGAAAMSCLLLRRGVPSVLVVTLVKTAVNGYRSGYLCQSLLEGSFGVYKKSDREALASALAAGSKSPLWTQLAARTPGLLQKSLDVQRKKMEIALSHLDAQDFVSSQPRILSECQSTKVSGTLTSFLRAWKEDTPCPSTLAADRCARMKHRVKTWIIDREWTEAQHMAGLEFAKKNCPAEVTTGREIEAAACQALQEKDLSESSSQSIE